ncbi:MAG: tetratricopeptide repeat protein [Acidobacteriota bacterium]
MTAPALSAFGQVRSAAMLKMWTREPGAFDQLPGFSALAESGIFRVRSDLFAFLPVAGDAQVIEAAQHTARQLFRASSADARALVFPGFVRSQAGTIEVASSDLLEDLGQEGPNLDVGRVYFTGHATHELESAWHLDRADDYVGPSGKTRTIFSLGEPMGTTVPWRNPRLLGKETRTVPRVVFAQLADALRAPGLVVYGPIGCGKSRAVHEALRNNERLVVWTRCWSERSGGPTIARQLATQLQIAHEEGQFSTLPPQIIRRDPSLRADWIHGTSEQEQRELEDILLRFLRTEAAPELTLVVDDAQIARPSDLDMALRVGALENLRQRLRLVVVGRSSGEWLQELAHFSKIQVPPMESSESASCWHQLSGGLSMPPPVEQQFLGACEGFPFAQEEGLLQLVRRRLLRQLYGNFFFSGAADVGYEASPRFVRHLESEALRLGNPDPLRVLAVAERAISADSAAETASVLGANVSEGWVRSFEDGDLVRSNSSRWGDTVALSAPAFAAALASQLDEDSHRKIRSGVVARMPPSGADESGTWESYQLVAGSIEGARAVLEMAKSPGRGKTARDLFQAIRDELEAHREREGDPETELALLWALLPLARRLSLLRGLDEAIERAIELVDSDPSRRLALQTIKAEHLRKAGKLREAEQELHECLEMSKGSEPVRQSLILVQIGLLLQRQGRYPEAKKLFEDFLPNVDQDGNLALAATCRFHLGNVALHSHHLEEALDFHQQALRIRQDNDLLTHQGASLAALGSVICAMGNYPRALRLYEQSEETLDQHGAPGEISYALLGKGRALTRLGDFTNASTPLRRGLEAREGLDDQMGEEIARLAIAENHLLLGKIEAAIEETRKAHFQLTLLDAARYVGDAEQLLGRIQLQQRQYESAAEHFSVALEKHRQHGYLLESTFDRSWLLEAALAMEDAGQIERLTRELDTVMKTIAYPELGETLDLRIYRGLMWLRSRGIDDSAPITVLQRAYRELFRKTEMLDQELRNRFLLQIPENQAILNAATEHGISGGATLGGG